MNIALDVVAFLDKKQEGRYPVFDTAGRPLAYIEVPWGSRKFTAVTAAGGALCSGKGHAFSRTYDVCDAYGNPLFTMKSGFWANKTRTITFPNGYELILHGEKWPSRDWAVRDASERVVLHIEATASTWSLHPDAYAVRIGDPNLTLAHVVGIVQANRILVKASRASAAPNAG